MTTTYKNPLSFCFILLFGALSILNTNASDSKKAPPILSESEMEGHWSPNKEYSLTISIKNAPSPRDCNKNQYVVPGNRIVSTLSNCERQLGRSLSENEYTVKAVG